MTNPEDVLALHSWMAALRNVRIGDGPAMIPSESAHQLANLIERHLAQHAGLCRAVDDLLTCARYVEAGTWHVSSDRMAFLREAWTHLQGQEGAAQLCDFASR